MSMDAYVLQPDPGPKHMTALEGNQLSCIFLSVKNTDHIDLNLLPVGVNCRRRNRTTEMRRHVICQRKTEHTLSSQEHHLLSWHHPGDQALSITGISVKTWRLYVQLPDVLLLQRTSVTQAVVYQEDKFLSVKTLGACGAELTLTMLLRCLCSGV